MNAIIYTIWGVPLIIGIIIVVENYRERLRKRRRKNILMEYNQFLLDEKRRKANLKIPGYYEDFFSSKGNSKYHSVNFFSTGNFW